jgi:hypothetical protein
VIVYEVVRHGLPHFGDTESVALHASRDGAMVSVEGARVWVDRYNGAVYAQPWTLGVDDVWVSGQASVRIVERELLP